MLNKWYVQQAQVKFAESLEWCWPKFYDLSFDKFKLSLRRMKKSWGSLSGRGTVTFNTHLIRAPKKCIDYVVTHELCHHETS